MKTGVLLGSLNRGGTETLILDVFKKIQTSQMDLIGIYRKKGVLEKDFQNSDTDMHYLPVGKNIFGYLYQLRRLIIQQNLTLLHAQQPIDALYARLATLGTKIPVILTMHGYDFNNSKLDRLILKIVLKITSQNLYVSNYQKEYYLQKYKLKPALQKVVYNGINLDKFETTVGANLWEELNIDRKSLLLGTVGNFVPGRDPMTLCRFLMLLNEQQVDFHFIFIGRKSVTFPQIYEECVDFVNRHGLSERVTFAGSREDVPALLHQLDAFLYATDHDTFGIAVVEAMAAGVPVFVNDWEVMTEITEEGKLATIYKTKDEKDLLEKFMLFLQTRETYNQKTKEVSVIVRQKYSIEKYIENLKIVYSQ